MTKQEMNAYVNLGEDVKVFGKALLEAEAKALHTVKQIPHPASYTDGYALGYEEGIHECLNCYTQVITNFNQRMGGNNEKDVVH